MLRQFSTPLGLRDPRDRVVVALAAVHVAVLWSWPSLPVVALGLWWNGNTVSHQFTHRPFWRGRGTDAAFSLLLSLLLGIPQRLWRQRHLAHHAGVAWRLRRERGLGVEIVACALGWSLLAALAPGFLLGSYLPGFAIGQGLCWLQGHYEHAGGTTSIYSRWWNLLFLEDGHHVEHHAAPGAHFRDLRWLRLPGARTSVLPPVLRWLDALSLDGLERLVLRLPWLRRRVLAVHQRALAALLPRCGPVRTVVIVGGGLFPRTALLLRELLPAAAITVLDADAGHLATAAPILPPGVETRRDTFVPGEVFACDLAVLPLALRGKREHVYGAPPAPCTLVHDWLWRRRGTSVVVAWWLGKRLNLVRATTAVALRVAG